MLNMMGVANMWINDLKLLLRFATVYLNEDVSQTPMTVLGTDTDPVILPDSGGYVMKNDQYLFGEGVLSNGYALDINNAATMGFWLYSADPGLALNPDTCVLSSITMPLLDIVDTGSSNNSVINITEHTSTTGNNYLTITYNENAYSASSEEYTPSEWHYFWIVMTDVSLEIYVDGKKNVLQNETSILSDPSNMVSLRVSFGDLYINNSRSGYGVNVAKNYGIIGDIFILNIANNSLTDIQRSINDGVEYVVDNDYTDSYISKYDVSFNDPETITITSMIDDMTYIFLGRNDGKILRGAPLLWETRISFFNNDEIHDLGLYVSSLDKGFLELKDTTIRL